MLPKTDYLECVRITDIDQRFLVSNFFIDRYEAKNLEVYLKNHALSDEVTGNARTYIVRERYSKEIVGYFSLKAGFVSTNEQPKSLFKNEFDCEPGIELSNFAVNSKYINDHPLSRNIGLYVFRYFIIPIVEMTAAIVGIRYLYIFALPYEKLIKTYEDKYGFERADMIQETKIHRRIRPRYDDECVFMFQRI